MECEKKRRQRAQGRAKPSKPPRGFGTAISDEDLVALEAILKTLDLP
jgi:hypothetical protein